MPEGQVPRVTHRLTVDVSRQGARLCLAMGALYLNVHSKGGELHAGARGGWEVKGRGG